VIYHLIFTFLFLLGLYAVLIHKNLIKMVIGLSIMESAAFLWTISLSNKGGMIPIYQQAVRLAGKQSFNDPVPQALTLTGIVIGASTTALLLTMIIELKKLAGSINPEEVQGLIE